MTRWFTMYTWCKLVFMLTANRISRGLFYSAIESVFVGLRGDFEPGERSLGTCSLGYKGNFGLLPEMPSYWIVTEESRIIGTSVRNYGCTLHPRCMVLLSGAWKFKAMHPEMHSFLEHLIYIT